MSQLSWYTIDILGVADIWVWMKSSFLFLFLFNFYIFNGKGKIDIPFLITTVRFLMKITHFVYQMKNHGFFTLSEKTLPKRSHERANYRFFFQLLP